jgi:hypothetical protein
VLVIAHSVHETGRPEIIGLDVGEAEMLAIEQTTNGSSVAATYRPTRWFRSSRIETIQDQEEGAVDAV